MEVIVLAGGLGKRLRNAVPDLPKPMAPIGDRPFLEILLDSLSEKGFSRVILSVGYRAERIMEYFGDQHRNMELVYQIESKPLGTGGAIRVSMNLCNEENIYIINGDTFLDFEIEELDKYLKKRGNPIIVARSVEDASRYGKLEVKGGCLVGFVEKGINGPGLINAGCYVLKKDMLNEYSNGEKFSFESDYLPDAIHQVQFDVFESKGMFIDIGIPQDYERAQREIKGDI